MTPKRTSHENDALQVDVRRFVVFNADPFGEYWTPAYWPGRRAGEVGQSLGTIVLKHSGGYEVLLRFPDGKVESFRPLDLLRAQHP